MKRTFFLTFSIITVVILLLLQLFVSHQLSTAGFEITAMESEKQALLRNNEELRHKIASASSLTTLTKRAKELGFDNADFLFLEQAPVALNR